VTLRAALAEALATFAASSHDEVWGWGKKVWWRVCGSGCEAGSCCDVAIESTAGVYLRRAGACGRRVGSHAWQLDHRGARARFPDQQPCDCLFRRRA
jgi:hypothetical protein